jgi:hypothetical protein
LIRSPKRWLLARAQRFETKAFEHLSGAQFDPDDADGRIITQMFKTNPGAYVSLQFYAAQAERSYYKAHRELQAAKQIQNEANFIKRMDATTTVSQRILSAPPPNHPSRNDPQYGSPLEKAAAQVRAGIRQNEPNSSRGA